MNDMLEGMLETALYADDLDKAEAFYEGILGLDKISRVANRHVFYRCGPGVLLIFNPEETIEPPAATWRKRSRPCMLPSISEQLRFSEAKTAASRH
jgi:catechol 2,3-dioxygenase-like lactoylglutathione lyase family enzyme